MKMMNLFMRDEKCEMSDLWVEALKYVGGAHR